jgi:hypothetical protein
MHHDLFPGMEMTPYVLALVAVLQALALFILADLRARVTRLEDHLMPPAWPIGERSKSHV